VLVVYRSANQTSLQGHRFSMVLCSIHVGSLLCLVSEPMSSSKYYQVILLLRLTTCKSHFIGPACKVETREQCNFHLDSCFEECSPGATVNSEVFFPELHGTFPILTSAGLNLP
jgi:hypothetical protein